MGGEETQKKDNSFFSKSALSTLFAAGIGGGVSRTAVSPIERVKILQQTQQMIPGVRPKYDGVIPSLQTIWREEGAKGLFKGNGANLIRIVPTCGLQFYSYDQYKRIWGENTELTPVMRMVSGGAAGATALLLTYPLEFVRGLLTVQTNEQRYRGVTDVIVKTVRSEGVKGIYRGLIPSLMGVIPFVAIDFTVYDVLKRHVLSRWHEGDAKPGAMLSLGCGCVAATCAQTASYPFDLVRRRLNVQGFRETHYHYKGLIDAFVTIVRTEGVTGLYYGVMANFLKIVPAMGITFMTVDAVRDWMGVGPAR